MKIIPSYQEYIVVLDANFLLIPLQFQLDIYSMIQEIAPSPHKLVSFSIIRDELREKCRNSSRPNAISRQIESSLVLADKKGVTYLESFRNPGENTDDAIVRMILSLTTDNHIYYLATNDKLLRKKASAKKIRVLYLRQKKRLAFDERST